MSALDRWVNDELHSIIGLSDRTLATYIISLARQSRTPGELVEKIRDADDSIPSNANIQDFASRLLDKLPKPVSAVRAPFRPQLTAEQQRAKDFERLNARLKPLSDVESDDDDEPVIRQPVKTKSDKKPSKSLRKRKLSESSEDEVVIKRDREPTDAKEDSEDADERDERERDAFAQRLREKEAKKGDRKVVVKSDAKAAEEAAKRLNISDTKDVNEFLKKARYVSRRDYLGKRTGDMTYELERLIQEEEGLFANAKLTEKERRDQEHNKQLLKYVKEYDKAGAIEKQQRYHLPDATTKLVQNKYMEDEEHPGGDGRKWENDKLKAAVFHAGSAKVKTDFTDELLLDDGIDFVKVMQLPGSNEEKEPQMSEKEKKKLTLEETRKSLPVYKYRDEFIEAVREHQVIIIEGETGSGKTTQLPQYLYEAGFCANNKRIGCTQPRRVAAMSVAARVAEEMNTKLGNLVGYSIRFEDCTSEKTLIKYMTDGMLLREFLNEPDLASYSVMMIDEAHERTLHTDVLFGLVKDIARFRPDLKLLIASATLDADKFSSFFDDAPIFRIPGRRYPVEIFYTKAPEADYCDAAVVTVLQIHMTMPVPGDILVFLTGQDEIENVQEALTEKIKQMGTKMRELIVLPIYANLPTDMQAKIFEPTPPDARKVVLATNIAETSVTIDGISYVIDPGFVKQNSYEARSNVEHLTVVPISKAASDQRAGRAGRTGPGKCFRLYTAWTYSHDMDDQPTPEIQRTNLGNVVLLLMSLGIYDILNFDFLDAPLPQSLAVALEHLYALGAINHNGRLTKLGRQMAEFPCDPSMSKMIIASDKYACSEEIITISAMLSVNAAVFYRPKAMYIHADTARKGFWDPTGDHLTLLNVYNRWKETNYSSQWCMENFVQYRTMKRARDVRDQLEGLLERVEIEPKSNLNDTVAIRKAIASGYFAHLAKLDREGAYKTCKHMHTTHIHPNSSLHEDRPRWVVYYELVFTSREFMREITEIDSKWLAEVAPHYYKREELDDSKNKKMPKTQGRALKDLER